jgi:NAD(P)-dependent dehydrogenase (short-subunit alcohol dehydrogenase family)
VTDELAPRRTALVTGASRGIGRAIALALAAQGFDVAVTARTVNDGDPASRSPETGNSLPGSLASTAAGIRACGVRCVPVVLDLLDRARLEPAVDEAVDALGGLDVLVNNAIYVGGGGGAKLLDSDPDDIVRRMWSNATAQILITRRALATMVPAGAGLVIGITSAAGQVRPPAPVGEGGWALTYAASKAGFHRIADMVATEYGSAGIEAYNINPGYVATERVRAAESLAFVASRGVEPSVVGDAVAKFVANPRRSATYDVVNGSYLQMRDLVGY